MNSTTEIPMFLAVNTGCNMSCGYCTEYGENRDTSHGRLAIAEIQRLLLLAYKCGYRTFRATGGEPTLRHDLKDILLSAQKLGSDVRIALTTNGARLGELIPTLERLNEPRVFVSVDAVEGTPITGSFTIEKVLTPALDQLIQSVRTVARTRINFVLSATTRNQLLPLVEYCVDRGVDLKIFELLHREYFYAGDCSADLVFGAEYLPVTELVAELRVRLGEPRPFDGTGGKGIPMQAFAYKGSQIIYFDSSLGSHYHELCSGCSRFPCQEGMYGAVLSATGLLHPAGCTNGQFHATVANAPDDMVIEAMLSLRSAIEASAFVPQVPNWIASWQGDRRVPVKIRGR